jgi:hypothetical protein
MTVPLAGARLTAAGSASTEAWILAASALMENVPDASGVIFSHDAAVAGSTGTVRSSPT